jgi:hypothetical protein
VFVHLGFKSFDLLAERNPAFAPDHQHVVLYLALYSQFHASAKYIPSSSTRQPNHNRRLFYTLQEDGSSGELRRHVG